MTATAPTAFATAAGRFHSARGVGAVATAPTPVAFAGAADGVLVGRGDVAPTSEPARPEALA